MAFRSFYDPPPKEGDSHATRSGIPPPKLRTPTDEPSHLGRNIMDLGMHLREIRERTRGMTPEEREWRKKWILDQKLHPDEPIRVEACYRQLNPVRRFYRYPMDRLYETVLEPKLDWTSNLGAFHVVPEGVIAKREEIDRDYPGLIEKALQPPKCVQDYGDEQFSKRLSHFNLGKSERPW